MIDYSLDKILGLCRCPHFVVIKGEPHCYSNTSRSCENGTMVYKGSRCWKYNNYEPKDGWPLKDWTKGWHNHCEYYD